MLSAICHTWRLLSSATLAMTQGSFLFQAKSDILALWPPWEKSNSGGPSSASNSISSCSSPTLSKQKTPYSTLTNLQNKKIYIQSSSVIEMMIVPVQVPDHQPSVFTGRCKHCFMVRIPLHLENLSPVIRIFHLNGGCSQQTALSEHL